MNLYPMKRLLVCTDLSPESDLVLKSANELRTRVEGTIDLLYVSDTGLQLENVLSGRLKSTFRDVFLKDLKTSLEEKMQEQVRRCQVDANLMIKDGAVDEVIDSIANEGHHDLIIMGHGKKTGLKRLTGSNAAKVIASAPVPLLIVKKPLSFNKIAGLIDESRPMDKLMIGTFNFMRNFHVKEALYLSLWIDFPKPLGNQEEGHLVGDRVKEEADHFAHSEAKYSIYVAPTRELKLADPIQKVLSDEKVDIAVLKRFTEGNLKRVYIGSTTRRLLDVFEGNLLIIPPSQ